MGTGVRSHEANTPLPAVEIGEHMLTPLTSYCWFEPENLTYSKMQAEPSSSEAKTSRYRGLSYDKKWQGWRVRLYWGKKQRHVGRYANEITAAKAYDKAAVFLYGTDAVTNFGLQACLADPTEVSPHIQKAMVEISLEAPRKLQQRMLQLKQQQSCSPFQPATPGCRERCTVQRYQPLLQQVQSTGMQQLYNLPAGTMLVYAPSPSTAAAPVTTSSSSSSGTSGCSTMIMQQQQQLAVQMNKPMQLCDPDYAARAMLTSSAAACTFEQQQQQQHCLPMCLPSFNQQTQLSVQPQLVTIAEHISAAAGVQPAPALHDQADQLLRLLSLPNCSSLAASTSGPWIIAAAAAPAAVPAAIPVSSMGQCTMTDASTYTIMGSWSPPAGVATPATSHLPSAVQSGGSALPSLPVTLAVPTTQFEQQLQLHETMSVCSNSGSCSPMAAATAAQLLDPATHVLFYGCY